MCGIVGYTGTREAVEIVLGGLDRLEYRGYDSAGIAVQNGRGLVLDKVSGSVARLRERIADGRIVGSCGIGHTRWATHGPPTEANAHPHLGCGEDLAVVHNGVIENADALRTLLLRRGHVFKSDTDTEILAHLIEEATGITLEDRVIEALQHVEGTYGLAVVWDAEPGKIVVARHGSPVLVGVGEGEYFVASDASAILEHTRQVVHIEDGDLAVITRDNYRVINRASVVQERSVDEVAWELAEVDRGVHPNFMHKEIAEQPDVIRRTMAGRLLPREGRVRLGGLGLDNDDIDGIGRLIMVACGTSWHACLLARYAIEELAGIPVAVEYASEFRYLAASDLRGTVTIAVSQSGETADTLEAVRAARRAGSRILGVVNVVGSSVAREAESGIYLRAGPEIGVASTKAFTSQVATLLLLAMRLGEARGMKPAALSELAVALEGIPTLMERALETDDQIRAIASKFDHAPSFLYLGRSVSFPVALEGALKLKEISYIHAEGYPAAEMKHGPIALIDEEMPVVCVAPGDELLPKMISNVQEVRARGGRVIAICSEGSEGELATLAEHVISVPRTPKLLSPLVTVIPLQLLAYHIAMNRGCDVDRPRNLAKSVTVE
ncbi:MAG: glutamine--fructose-6-phosphate transaminase (isomerizing) [Longimicrobiales bacterium]|nr:glutamine--fructose-6-phosphate transaminase (isomerizing) [Longimicrobiales bacterium]